MMTLIDSSLVCQRPGRRVVELEVLEVGYRVRALVQFSIDPEVARVFAFSNADRSKVIELGRRRKVIL